MSYSEKTFEDTVSLSFDDTQLRKYLTIMNKQSNISIKTQYSSLPIPTSSFNKICLISSQIPLESLRFTLYINSDDSKTPPNTITIPDYSLNTNQSTTMESMSVEETQEIPKIHPTLFMKFLSNSYLRKSFRCIYPIFLVHGVVRLIWFWLMYYEMEENSFNIYHILSLMLIGSSFGIGVFGIYTFRKMRIGNWRILNIVSCAILLQVISVVYIIWAEDGFGNEIAKKYETEHKTLNIIYYITLVLSCIISIVINFLLQRKYYEWVNSKYNQINNYSSTNAY